MGTRWLLSCSAGVLLAAVVIGCGSGTKPVASAPTEEKHAESGHSHDGWWCDEHGVPEEICAQCNVKLAAEFQQKGDWCKMHDRPDSQCFICHPELEKKFAAQYQAKYGKQPPKPTEEEHGKEEKPKS